MTINSRTRTMRMGAFHERGTGRKRLTAVAAIAAISVGTIGLTGSSASADRPVEFGESITFTDVNPCTESPMEVTINFVVRLHEHGDRFVAHVSRTGSTDDGYVMDHGVETASSNGNVFRQAVADRFRNEDGSTFQIHGVLVEKEDGVRVDRLTLRCLDH